MPKEITQSQISTSTQAIRKNYVKVNILDFNFRTLDSIQGNLISGEVQVNANNDIRRTCSLTFVVTDSSLEVAAGGRVFLDKFIQIFSGTEDIITSEIVWNNMGVYLINQPTYTYNATNKILSFQGLDLMSKLTGVRNGYIGGLGEEDVTLLKTGDNVRNCIIAILTENGFNRYVVSECENVDGVIQQVPYDMEFGQGSTWFDVLSALRNILPQYQIFFDVDGVFHYEMIPSSNLEPIRIESNFWKDVVISENIEIDFENVKNAIEVYGVTHETEYFSEPTVVLDNSSILLTINPQATETEYMIVGFTLPVSTEGNITVNVNSWGEKPLVDEKGDRITYLGANTYWAISYQANNTWLFMGHLQAQGYWEDNNPESPFYVYGSVGKILIPLYGGDYENIQTDYLALQRAKYEIYKRCRLNDTIKITTTPVYWADVNWKVEYSPLGENQINQYIIQSVYTNLAYDGQQTWELSRFYPYYPDFN